MKGLASFITLCLLVPTTGNLQAASKQVIDINDLLIVAAPLPVEGIDTMQDMPMGQGDTKDVSLLPEDTGAPGDLFGIEGGYFHPYVSVEGAFTDNLYNVDDNTTSNFLTTISPGIWFTLPRKTVIPITIAPHNTAPGGLSLQVGDYDGTDKYQLYALAGTDLLFYSEDSDLNTADVGLEAMGRYNMASGLSLQLLDRYSIGHDEFGTDGATDENLREFQSNIVLGTADWDITEKLRLKTDVSNFYLDYEDSLNAFLDRQDNAVDVYGFFNYSPKTSLFLEYKYVDVAYDTDTDSDNNQNFYYAGVSWRTTEKVSLLFKAGLQQKAYDTEQTGYADSDNLALDMQILYIFTEKTQATLDIYSLNEESDSSLASEKEVLGVELGYTQKFTEKITGKISLFYENAVYNQLEGEDRTDDTFEVSPSVQYLFKDWLMSELGYSFAMDDSTDEIFDYSTNTVFLNLNFSL